jgi:aerobic carbon-monoxide dehydrogenase medium subunit
MYAFDYHRPATLDQVRSALARDPESKLLAGGMSLVPVMRHRLARPSTLIDLNKIDALKGITQSDGRLRIGAMNNHYTVSTSDLVKCTIPALAQLAGGIGDPLVRNRGTIGGSLAHNDPAACYPAATVALGATIYTSCRELAADDFFLGTFTTALQHDEIIIAVGFPVPDCAAYMKFINSASRFSIVGVFVARFGQTVRVGVTGAGAHAYRFGPVEQALTKSFTPQAARAVKVAADGLIDDINGSAAYRAHLIGVLSARAVEHCLAGTPGQIL